VSRLIEVPPDRGGGSDIYNIIIKVNPPPPSYVFFPRPRPAPLARSARRLRSSSPLWLPSFRPFACSHPCSLSLAWGSWVACSCKHSHAPSALGHHSPASTIVRRDQGRGTSRVNTCSKLQEQEFTLRFASSLLRSSRRLIIILMSVPSCAGTIVVVYPRAPIVIYELYVRRGSSSLRRVSKNKTLLIAFALWSKNKPFALRACCTAILLNVDGVRTFVLSPSHASVVPLSLFPSLSYFVKTRVVVRWYYCKERSSTTELPLLGHCERQAAGAITKERACCTSPLRVRRTDVLNYKNIRSDTLYCRSLKTWPVLTTPDREIKERGINMNYRFKRRKGLYRAVRAAATLRRIEAQIRIEDIELKEAIADRLAAYCKRKEALQ